MKKHIFIVLIVLVSVFCSCSSFYNKKPSDSFILASSKEVLERIVSSEKIVNKIVEVKKIDGLTKGDSYVAIVEFIATNSFGLADIVANSRGSWSKLEFAYSLFNKYGAFKAGDFRFKYQTQLEFVKSEKSWVIVNSDSLKIMRIDEDKSNETKL